MLLDLFFNLLIGMALAALIGAEREMIQTEYKNPKKNRKLFGGVRTHILLAITGSMTAYIATEMQMHWLIGVAFVLVGLFLLAAYFYNVVYEKHIGITTEITGLLTFLLGVLTMVGQTVLAVMIGVFIAIILISKHYLSMLLHNIGRKELFNTLKFAVILFVIYPLLPETPIDPWGIINIQTVWWNVILISGISYVGYVLSKTVGTSKGIALSGALGGLASSTAVTHFMAVTNKKTPKVLYPFVIATIIAASMMFFRILIWVYSKNIDLLYKLLLPIVLMGVTSAALVGVFFWLLIKQKHEEKHEAKEPPLNSPFQVLPALEFGLFFMFIAIVSFVSQKFFGDQGIYAVSLISGLADIDAITLLLAEQSGDGTISNELAAQGIMIALIANSMVKLGIAKVFGGKVFGNLILLAFVITLGVGAGALLLL